MSTLLTLLDKAIDLTFNLLTSNREARTISDKPTEFDTTELTQAIHAVTAQIDRTAVDVLAGIAHSVERTQLEKLSIQAKSLELAIELGNEVMLGQAVLALSELTTYSTMRIAEGKHEWFAPWMIAESVRIEGLRLLAKDEKAANVVDREIQHFRMNILNYVGKFLLDVRPVPWQEIADFVDGRNDVVLTTIRTIPFNPVRSGKAEQRAQTNASSVDGSKLQSSSAWMSKVHDFFE